ncbi:MAG: homocitrate synthase, partial [Thermodesulfobacteriota bacterium]
IITTGEYGGIKGFRHVYDNLGIHFQTDDEARRVLELVQYANLHTQKPLTDDELHLIATYPDIVRKMLTVSI